MNITELYAQTPRNEHSDILISGNRLFCNGEEYIVNGDGELKLVHSQKVIEQKINEIRDKLAIK